MIPFRWVWEGGRLVKREASPIRIVIRPASSLIWIPPGKKVSKRESIYGSYHGKEKTISISEEALKHSEGPVILAHEIGHAFMDIHPGSGYSPMSFEEHALRELEAILWVPVKTRGGTLNRKERKEIESLFVRFNISTDKASDLLSEAYQNVLTRLEH